MRGHRRDMFDGRPFVLASADFGIEKRTVGRKARADDGDVDFDDRPDAGLNIRPLRRYVSTINSLVGLALGLEGRNLETGNSLEHLTAYVR